MNKEGVNGRSFLARPCGLGILLAVSCGAIAAETASTLHGRMSERVDLTLGAEPSDAGSGVHENFNRKLGSASGDQVFVPIVPCRIVDTRNVGGPISAGTTRSFFFYATGPADDWSGQGGVAGPSGSACPGTILPNGGVYGPAAAVVTITVVSPTAPGNWILWGGANPVPTASALNWTAAGQILANTTVIPWGGRTGAAGPGGPVQDFSVKYNGMTGSAQFVADLVGYLVENEATTLDCYETPLLSMSVTGLTNPPKLTANACSVGWSLTSGNCDRDSTSMVLQDDGAAGTSQAAWACGYHNLGAGAGNVYASSICCRVPGR